MKTLRMPSVAGVVARSEPGKFIGIDNQLPWHLGTDLSLFKKVTTGHVVIMGRKTFDSIGRPLPNRINIVLTRQQMQSSEILFPVGDPETALLLADWKTMWLGNKTSFIIGGGQVYSLFEKYINDIYLTMVNAPDINGDAKFEWEFDPKEWKTEIEDEYPISEKDDYSFRFCKFSRRKKRLRERQITEFMAHDLEIAEWMKQQFEAEENKKWDLLRRPDTVFQSRKSEKQHQFVF